MKRPALTLIETIVALGIALVLLGAAVATARSIEKSARQSEQSLHMVRVADEVITAMQAAQKGSSGTFASALGLAASGTQTIVPYRSGSTVAWCRQGSGGACLNTLAAAATQSGETLSTQMTTGQATSGELVLVKRSTAATGALVSNLSPEGTPRVVAPTDPDWLPYRRLVTVTPTTTPTFGTVYDVTVTIELHNQRTIRRVVTTRFTDAFR